MVSFGALINSFRQYFGIWTYQKKKKKNQGFGIKLWRNIIIYNQHCVEYKSFFHTCFREFPTNRRQFIHSNVVSCVQWIDVCFVIWIEFRFPSSLKCKCKCGCVCVCVLCASFKLSKFLFHFIQFGFYSIQLASVKSIDWCFIPRKLNHLRVFLLQPNPKWFVPFQWISLPINTCRFYNAYRTENMNIEMTWR